MSKANGNTKREPIPRRKLTQAELCAEAKERFGDDWLKWAFQCPNCGDVASFADFKEAGAGASLCGQECIGRHLGALKREPDNERGCNWAAYGLFRGPWEVVVPADKNGPARSIWSFPLAEAPIKAEVKVSDERVQELLDGLNGFVHHEYEGGTEIVNGRVLPVRVLVGVDANLGQAVDWAIGQADVAVTLGPQDGEATVELVDGTELVWVPSEKQWDISFGDDAAEATR